MMPLRRWQARIEIVDEIDWEDVYQTTYVYGETTDQLREAARTYLLNLEERPRLFSNGGDHIVGRKTYFYSFELEDDESSKKNWEPEWWYQGQSLVRGQIQESFYGPPEKLKSFEEAVDHFVRFALIPEKGPDYHSKAMVGNNLRLALLEKILRETEEHPLNDLIQRGWHIVALEYRGELSMTGELINRKAIFVMGHPEAKVAIFTLNADHYKNHKDLW